MKATDKGLHDPVRTLDEAKAAMNDKTEAFERIVRVTPAYDRRDEGFGIGSVRMVFILKGPEGAVQFAIGSEWYLPETHEHLMRFRHIREPKLLPSGWGVACHTKEETYAGQTNEPCDLLDGGRCFYSESLCMADDWMPDFVAGGTDWLWPRLEQQYREWVIKSQF